MHQDQRGYWYRSKRVGSGPASRVEREYMGRGEVAMLGAQLEALDAQREREERAAQLALVEEAQAQARAVEGPLERLGALADGVMRQVLEGAGYHLHARSQWRKKRGNSMSNQSKEAVDNAVLQKFTAMGPGELEALGHRARTDRSAAREYLDILELAGLLEDITCSHDMARQAEHTLIESMQGPEELTKEMWKRRMAALRRELEGENATPLERMLAERIVVCWFHVHLIEMTVAYRAADMTLTVGEYQQKRLDRAHKRHLSAIKALAQVRKMALPAPPVLMLGSVTGPVNVGGHQVNVAANGRAESKASRTASAGVLATGAHDPEASRLERAASPVAAGSGFAR